MRESDRWFDPSPRSHYRSSKISSEVNLSNSDFSCSVCNRTFASPHSLSGHKKVHSINYAQSLVEIGKTLSEQAKSKYLSQPRKCHNCESCIPYEKVLRNCYVKFCSSNCSAIYNNRARGPRKEETKAAISLTLRSKGKKLPFFERVNKREAKNFYDSVVFGPFTNVFHCNCKHCNCDFISGVARKYCKNHSQLYLDEGRNLYEFTFNLFSFPHVFCSESLLKLKEKGFWNPANKLGITRDHGVSVNKSIRKGYDPFYIKHPINCELMGWQENIRKNTKSSMTYESLVLKVDQYEISKWRKEIECSGIEQSGSSSAS